MLKPDQEQDLALAWRDRRDEEALRQLTGSHLRLVIKIARGFAGYGLPASELIAEGNVGLMQAAQKFDPDRGFRFATYAIWWIRASIQEYILHNWSMVKMGTTAAQKKLFFNLRRLKGRMEELEQGDLSPETVASIATELDVPEAEVIEMNRRLSMGDSSLNAAVGGEGDTDWLDLLSDERPTQESVVAEADEMACAAACLVRRWKSSTTASARSCWTPPCRRAGHAGSAWRTLRRIARAYPPDRGPRFRKTPEGGAERLPGAPQARPPADAGGGLTLPLFSDSPRTDYTKAGQIRTDDVLKASATGF